MKRLLLRSAMIIALSAGLLVPQVQNANASTNPSGTTNCDFDGDGFDDLAVGVPGEDVGEEENAGAVNVIYGGSGAGLSSADNQILTQQDGVPEDGDRFGASLACADFDGDGHSDLAIGTPGEAVGSDRDAGVVNIVYGSSSGLDETRTDMFSQDSAGIPGGSESGDLFGWAVAAGDFDSDGLGDLAIGAPGEVVGTIPEPSDPESTVKESGAVTVIYGAPLGLGNSTVGGMLLHQNLSGVRGTAESHDVFGYSLATGDFDGDGRDDLAVGVPGEGIGNQRHAGLAQIFYGTPGPGIQVAENQIFHGDNLGAGSVSGDRFAHSLTTGDFDGDGRDDLAAGVPGRGEDGSDVAGAAHVIYGTNAGLGTADNALWDQASPNIEGATEAFDGFGLAVAAGDFDGDGRDDLAVGVPGEDLDNTTNTGAVAVLYGSGSGIAAAGDQLWLQGRDGVTGAAEADDQLGYALATGDFDNDGRSDLAASAPGDSVGGTADVGLVNVLYGTSGSGLSASGDQVWHQNRSGVHGAGERGDRLGGPALSTGVYRTGYGNGTVVSVGGDEVTHSPASTRQKVDIGAQGSPAPIVAVSSGVVQFVDAGDEADPDCESNSEEGSDDDNSYVWISHENGEWSKISHLVDIQVTPGTFVFAGATLGTEGCIGSAGGNHLHGEIVNREGLTGEPTSSSGSLSGARRTQAVCNLVGFTYIEGIASVAGSC